MRRPEMTQHKEPGNLKNWLVRLSALYYGDDRLKSTPKIFSTAAKSHLRDSMWWDGCLGCEAKEERWTLEDSNKSTYDLPETLLQDSAMRDVLNLAWDLATRYGEDQCERKTEHQHMRRRQYLQLHKKVHYAMTGSKDMHSLHEAAEDDWEAIPKKDHANLDKASFYDAWLSLADQWAGSIFLKHGLDQFVQFQRDALDCISCVEESDDSEFPIRGHSRDSDVFGGEKTLTFRADRYCLTVEQLRKQATAAAKAAVISTAGSPDHSNSKSGSDKQKDKVKGQQGQQDKKSKDEETIATVQSQSSATVNNTRSGIPESPHRPCTATGVLTAANSHTHSSTGSASHRADLPSTALGRQHKRFDNLKPLSLSIPVSAVQSLRIVFLALGKNVAEFSQALQHLFDSGHGELPQHADGHHSSGLDELVCRTADNPSSGAAVARSMMSESESKEVRDVLHLILGYQRRARHTLQQQADQQALHQQQQEEEHQIFGQSQVFGQQYEKHGAKLPHTGKITTRSRRKRTNSGGRTNSGSGRRIISTNSRVSCNNGSKLDGSKASSDKVHGASSVRPFSAGAGKGESSGYVKELRNNVNARKLPTMSEREEKELAVRVLVDALLRPSTGSSKGPRKAHASANACSVPSGASGAGAGSGCGSTTVGESLHNRNSSRSSSDSGSRLVKYGSTFSRHSAPHTRANPRRGTSSGHRMSAADHAAAAPEAWRERKAYAHK